MESTSLMEETDDLLEPRALPRALPRLSLLALLPLVLGFWALSHSQTTMPPLRGPRDFVEFDIVPLDMQTPNFDIASKPAEAGTCAGQIQAATLWAANIGLKITAAVQDCDPDNFPRLANETGNFVSQDRDLRAAYCARDVITTVRDMDQVADFITGAEQACQREEGKDTACARSIEAAVFAATNIARNGAELQIYCPSNFTTNTRDADNFFRCAERLEVTAWNVNALGSAIARAAEKCPEKPPKSESGLSGFNTGACVSAITSATAYVACAGLYMTTAVGRNCPAQAVKPPAVQTQTSNEGRTQCARDSLAFVRTLALAASFASNAGKHCGGPKGGCSEKISFATSALVGAGETATNLHLFCNGPPAPPCCNFTDIKLVKQNCNCSEAEVNALEDSTLLYDTECARYSSSFVKLLSVAAAMATQAQGECSGHRMAKEQCGATVASAIAGFGFMSENLARMPSDCKKTPGNKSDDSTAAKNSITNFFACGQRLGFIGDALDTSSRTIGAAVANCGLGNVRAVTPNINLRRRFFTP